MANFYLPLVDMDTGRETNVEVNADEAEILEEFHAQMRLIEGVQVDPIAKFRTGLRIDMLDWGKDYNPRDVRGSIYVMGRGQTRTHWKITIGKNGHVLGLFLYLPVSFFPDVVSGLSHLQALKVSLTHVPIDTWPEFPSNLCALQIFNPKGKGVFPQESLRDVRKVHLIMPFDRVVFDRTLNWRVALFFLSTITVRDFPNTLEILSLNSCEIHTRDRLFAHRLKTFSIHNCTIHNEFTLQAWCDVEVSGRVNFDILEGVSYDKRFIFNFDTKVV